MYHRCLCSYYSVSEASLCVLQNLELEGQCVSVSLCGKHVPSGGFIVRECAAWALLSVERSGIWTGSGDSGSERRAGVHTADLLRSRHMTDVFRTHNLLSSSGKLILVSIMTFISILIHGFDQYVKISDLAHHH